LAKAASSNSKKSRTPAKTPARKTSAPAKPAADGGDFALHSLQEAFDKDRRYKASEEELLGFYEQMLLIRRFEEKAGQLYGLGLIGGFCHLYIGQEAVAVGLQSGLEEGKDSVITGYRDHGHMLAYGLDPKVIMAELTGRQAGISKGKGGSMHMFSTEHAFYGGHGIVGAQVPLGAGLAFTHKYNEDGGITLAYFGDGAARGRSTRPSTWPACGSCRSSSWSRTTSTPWAPRSSAAAPRPSSTAAAPRSASPAWKSTGWTFSKSTRPAESPPSMSAPARVRC
jgi:pyruvate dehydrogenase E1 component alpha subunit